MRLRGLPDDSKHSVVGKARPLQQAALEAFLVARSAGEVLPNAEFGRYEVREVEAKQALTKCAMPSEPWALNPYMGCSHDCAYCYVPDVAHVERPKWGSYVIVKRNLPTLLAREMQRKERRDVFLSSATDPYQPAEATHLVTRRCLEVMLKHDWPLGVLTRNPLVKRDVLLLKQFSEVEVGLSVPTLDDEARKLVEPGAPNIEGRLRTLRALADEGLETYANLMPAYPLTGGFSPDDVARAFRDAGVRAVYAGAWRYLDSVRPILRQRVAGTPYEAVLETVREPGYYARMFRALERAFERARVPLKVVYPEPAARFHPMDWTSRGPFDS
jgi:DNA repair photolyase